MYQFDQWREDLDWETSALIGRYAPRSWEILERAWEDAYAANDWDDFWLKFNRLTDELRDVVWTLERFS